MLTGEQLRFAVEGAGTVSALLARPKNPRWLLVLAQGAGAGMTHPFMEKLSEELGAVDVATFRYQLPYIEQRRRVPDSPAVPTPTAAPAVQSARKTPPGPPLLAAGKPLSRRTTQQ